MVPQLAFRQTRIVTDQGVREAGPGGIMGFLMIEAENMEAAIAVARQCPFLAMGTMRVAEAWMSRPRRLNPHGRLHRP